MSRGVWMGGVREAAIRAQNAARARWLEEQRRDYALYRAEQRACGYEVESFEEWLGEAPGARREQAEINARYEMEHGA